MYVCVCASHACFSYRIDRESLRCVHHGSCILLSLVVFVPKGSDSRPPALRLRYSARCQNATWVLYLGQEEFRHEEDEFSQSSDESSLGLALDEAFE